jgi:hypothetical protein
MSWRITYLNALIRSGHTGMTLEAFWNKDDKAMLGLSLLSGTDSLVSPLIGLLGTPLSSLNDNQPLIGTLGSSTSMSNNHQALIGTLGLSTTLFTDSLTRIHGVPLVEFELPDNWGTGTAGRTGTPLDVTAFSKLVVKGNIRLYLNYSDAPRGIVVFASPDAKSALKLKQSGGRLKLTNTHSTELIDIEVSGPLLESIRTAGNALFFKKAKEKE